jgi:hypothetical protein
MSLLNLSYAKPFYRLAELQTQTGFADTELGPWIFTGALQVSVMVSGLRADFGNLVEGSDGDLHREHKGSFDIHGPMGLYGTDVWPLFSGQTSCLVKEVRTGEDYYATITHPQDGYAITREKLIVLPDDLSAFEDYLSAGRLEAGARSRAANYDWEAMYNQVVYYVVQNGWPERQSQLVRYCLDWFLNTRQQIPDESSVKKRISRLYRNRPTEAMM